MSPLHFPVGSLQIVVPSSVGNQTHSSHWPSAAEPEQEHSGTPVVNIFPVGWQHFYPTQIFIGSWHYLIYLFHWQVSVGGGVHWLHLHENSLVRGKYWGWQQRSPVHFPVGSLHSSRYPVQRQSSHWPFAKDPVQEHWGVPSSKSFPVGWQHFYPTQIWFGSWHFFNSLFHLQVSVGTGHWLHLHVNYLVRGKYWGWQQRSPVHFPKGSLQVSRYPVQRHSSHWPFATEPEQAHWGVPSVKNFPVGWQHFSPTQILFGSWHFLNSLFHVQVSTCGHLLHLHVNSGLFKKWTELQHKSPTHFPIGSLQSYLMPVQTH